MKNEPVRVRQYMAQSLYAGAYGIKSFPEPLPTVQEMNDSEDTGGGGS